MSPLDATTALLIAVGFGFFVAGTFGMLRFPDVYTRLHALTKADNVGLGFVVAGLIVQASRWREVFELLLIWLLVMLASTTAAHVIAADALEHGVQAREEDQP